MITQNAQRKPKHPAIIYLRQYGDMKLRRDDLKEELHAIRENATRATSRYTAERMSGTSMHDGMANAAVRAVEVEQKLERCIRNIEEALAVRVWLIEQMKDDREKTILTERYISRRDWPDIQKRLFISRSRLLELHGYALNHFWEIYSREMKKSD